MEDKLMLMIPGPTPVPEQALLALARAPIGHRSGDFSKVFADVTAKLQWLHQTQHEVLILTASGTGAMEAGIINFLRRGDRVLVGENGKFGERWGDVCDAYGLQTERVKAPWGHPLDPEVFRERLTADSAKTIKAVIITHSETSTGVLNDLVTINRYVQDHGTALIMVDAVTSMGATSVPMDEWGLDVVASGSQKGYMIPPGLGFVAVGPRAWEAYKTSDLPRYYLDLGKARKDGAKNTTPFTTSVNMVMALQASLSMMQREGLASIFARHHRQQQATRAAVTAMGLGLLAGDHCASPSITAVLPPAGVDAEKVRSHLKKHFDIVVAGGQDQLSGKIFRLGHLGFVADRDILAALAALEATLQQLGHAFPAGAGISAAIAQLGQA
ncbi:MAG: alanine--glyoxylate aminotransferase family protein [Oscillatoriales cyanobacterium SM2_2_1]|nr:alanine--glyoxylate aminotransferase family protein [Oscillatoriales cyanobacterium SM2_2_1]